MSAAAVAVLRLVLVDVTVSNTVEVPVGHVACLAAANETVEAKIAVKNVEARMLLI